MDPSYFFSCVSMIFASTSIGLSLAMRRDYEASISILEGLLSASNENWKSVRNTLGMPSSTMEEVLKEIKRLKESK